MINSTKNYALQKYKKTYNSTGVNNKNKDINKNMLKKIYKCKKY